MAAEKPPEINSLHDVLDAVEHVRRRFSQDYFVWWRGQSSAERSWRLTPKVHRKGANPVYERTITSAFMLRARTRYPDCPDDSELDRWLYLMQHYGLPTRLLDWTDSVLFATFFAVRKNDKHDNESATLWAFDPVLLNEFQIDATVVCFEPSREIRSLFQPAFEDKAPQVDKIAALFANQVDIRMLVQLSAFTIHGTAKPLEDLDNNDKFLIKFVVPASAKAGLREELFRLGIRESNLFPDLEHLAQELAEMQPSQPETEERLVEPPP